MSNVRLRIADLRRKKHLSQQQLADVVGVSFQTISKWENGTAMPQITSLPVLAEFFDVSVDQLLGLVPLKEETYVPTATESSGSSSCPTFPQAAPTPESTLRRN